MNGQLLVRYDAPERPSREGVKLQLNGAALPVITLVAPEGAEGSWLACIHAARGGNRFGYHSTVLPDLREFGEAYLANPEAALAKFFDYLGPEETVTPQRAREGVVELPDLWEREG